MERWVWRHRYGADNQWGNEIHKPRPRAARHCHDVSNLRHRELPPISAGSDLMTKILASESDLSWLTYIGFMEALCWCYYRRYTREIIIISGGGKKTAKSIRKNDRWRRLETKSNKQTNKRWEPGRLFGAENREIWRVWAEIQN